MVKLWKISMNQMTALVLKPTVHQIYTFLDWLFFIYLWCVLSGILILYQNSFILLLPHKYNILI